MPQYDYACPTHGTFSVVKKMIDAGELEKCPDCGAVGLRQYAAPPVTYHSDGFHNTDYFRGTQHVGSKQDILRKRYEQETGEPAPPPAKGIKRSSGEPV